MKKSKTLSPLSNSSEGGLTKIALQKFKRNLWGVLSFSFLVLCVLVAIFAYSLAPDNSQNANQMHLSIHSKEPGFKVTLLTIPSVEKSQNTFSDFFFGKKITATEIPISDYSIETNTINIVEYTTDGEGLQKNYDLTLFPKASTVDEIPGIIFQKEIFY